MAIYNINHFPISPHVKSAVHVQEQINLQCAVESRSDASSVAEICALSALPPANEDLFLDFLWFAECRPEFSAINATNTGRNQHRRRDQRQLAKAYCPRVRRSPKRFRRRQDGHISTRSAFLQWSTVNAKCCFCVTASIYPTGHITQRVYDCRERRMQATFTRLQLKTFDLRGEALVPRKFVRRPIAQFRVSKTNRELDTVRSPRHVSCRDV